MKFPLAILFRSLLPAVLLAACSKSPDQPSPAVAPAALSAENLKALNTVTADRAVRLVWLEQADPAKSGRQLFAYGSADGLGLRSVPDVTGDLARPLLTSDGESIVFTKLNARPGDGKTVYAPEIFIRPWAGGAAKSLCPGMAVDLWRDPSDNKEYVYAVEHLLSGTTPRLTGEKLLRFLPVTPQEKEIIWTATTLGTDQFQLSADGRRAAGLFPFPKAGIADLTNQTLTPLPAGAWPALAADNSYAAALLDGSRRRLRVFAPNLDPGWELTFMGASGWRDGGILHPRWTNDPAVLVCTGPYQEEGTAADLCLVRFRDDLRTIQQVARLTEGRRAFSPDAWVEKGSFTLTALPQQPMVIPRPAPKPWPITADSLCFAWENHRRTAPLPQAPASLTPHGFAIWGRYHGMDPSGGWFEADPAMAAKISQDCAASSAWAMELILTERQTPPPVSVRLAALMLEDGREAFALYRVDRKLVLRILLGGTPDKPARVHPVVLTNLAIESDRPVHLALSLRNNRLACWLDGQMQKDFQLESSGLAAWGAGRLIFGDPQPYGSPWSGVMERIAIYSRALGDDEIRTAAETAGQFIETRTRPTRHKVKATLAVLPALGETTVSNQAAVSLWDVNQVFSGGMDIRRIAVLSWIRLQGRPLPSTFPAVGQSMDLILESGEDHPELESIPQLKPPGLSEDTPQFFYAVPLTPPAP